MILPTLAAALALAACSTPENTTAEIGNVADGAGNVIANAGEALDLASSNVAEATGNAVAEATRGYDAWIGRWRGVEGMYLEISKGAGPGQYRLEMAYTLDDEGSFDGVGTFDGIAFTRPDGKHVLRASDGDAIGLKYLDGEKNCLMVKEGEGYCRD
ncbi:hypothetical protein [Sphingomonas soli]|uniref:hypothetical protein n=1 Tax=Sphingomonas soli TaxID=266127 RepID=UPI00082C7107|nr:hypothetical protein [Sphingomonas soli]